MTRRRRLVPALLLLLLVAALGSGCVGLPDSGPVVETRSEGDVSSESGIYINPRPPQPGDTRPDVVRGFMVAMTATPVRTDIAKKFLTEEASASWAPENRTITYAARTPPQETENGVTVTLSEPYQLDSRGGWQGALPSSERTLDFPMDFKDGEWRIDRAPDALIVPEAWFQQRYRQVSLYFFDPTATILAPEPVFVERGETLATTLIQGLLKGPGAGMGRVTQSFVPAGLKVAVGVSVSEDGLADIQLTGDSGQLTAKTTELMLAQLAWTLRQESDIESFRVSVNGEPIPLPGGESSYGVDAGSEYDPTGYWSSTLLYALHGGRLVAGTASAFEPAPGPLGTRDYGLRSVGVSLNAERVAGVGADGGSVLMAPLTQSDGGRVQQIATGRDFLRPAWDFADRSWLVDRTARGAVVSYVENERTSSIRVPGITGERVRHFLVSRDGTRLIAVVRHHDRDVIVVSRIKHTSSGHVLGATPAKRLSAGGNTELPIRDISWRTSSSIAILRPFSASLAEVSVVSVDGSPSGPDSTATTVEGRLRTLTGSPAPDEDLYGFTGRSLVNLSSPDRQTTGLEKGTTALVYAG